MSTFVEDSAAFKSGEENPTSRRRFLATFGAMAAVLPFARPAPTITRTTAHGLELTEFTLKPGQPVPREYIGRPMAIRGLPDGSREVVVSLGITATMQEAITREKKRTTETIASLLKKGVDPGEYGLLGDIWADYEERELARFGRVAG